MIESTIGAVASDDGRMEDSPAAARWKRWFLSLNERVIRWHLSGHRIDARDERLTGVVMPRRPSRYPMMRRYESGSKRKRSVSVPTTGNSARDQSRFRLNANLAIAFDGHGGMEVDLLCEDPRVVIEVDGALHLGDAEAYRRDRRKDRLLQEDGYTVLRFLAEDLAKDLDTVLDAITRVVGSASSRRSTGRAL